MDSLSKPVILPKEIFRCLPDHSQGCLPKSPDDEESVFSNGEMALSEVCRPQK